MSCVTITMYNSQTSKEWDDSIKLFTCNECRVTVCQVVINSIPMVSEMNEVMCLSTQSIDVVSVCLPLFAL